MIQPLTSSQEAKVEQLVKDGVFPEDWRIPNEELANAIALSEKFRKWMDENSSKSNREGWLQVAAVAAYCQLWLDKSNYPEYVNIIRDFLIDYSKKCDERMRASANRN